MQPVSRALSFCPAEDGVRGADVTAVQTCALPISADASCDRPPPRRPARRRRRWQAPYSDGASTVTPSPTWRVAETLTTRRSEERRVGKESSGRWSPDQDTYIARTMPALGPELGAW